VRSQAAVSVLIRLPAVNRKKKPDQQRRKMEKSFAHLRKVDSWARRLNLLLGLVVIVTLYSARTEAGFPLGRDTFVAGTVVLIALNLANRSYIFRSIRRYQHGDAPEAIFRASLIAAIRFNALLNAAAVLLALGTLVLTFDLMTRISHHTYLAWLLVIIIGGILGNAAYAATANLFTRAFLPND